jgi:hypothetical protein
MNSRMMIVTLVAALTFQTIQAGDAQTKLNCDEKVSFDINDMNESFNRQIVTAMTTTPGVFPNPSKTEFIDVPFVMTCPSFTASSVNDSFSITGDVLQNFKRLRGSSGGISLLYVYGWKYPSIREGFWSNGVSIRIQNNKFVVESDDEYNVWFRDAVVAVRLNGGPLKPVYFEGKVTQIQHGPKDLIQLYLKGSDRQFDYLVLDLKKGYINVQNGVEFPSQ